jgi:hypothetical protein
MAEQMSKFWRAVLLFGKGIEKEEKDGAFSQFLSQLRPFFQTKGFQFRHSGDGFRFVKVQGDFTWSFELGVSHQPDSFRVKPAAGIRHEQIERIFHRVSGAPETVQNGSVTVAWGRALEKRIPKPYSFEVERLVQTQKAVVFTENFFTKWVEQFFNENSNLQAISNTYNNGRSILRAEYFTDWFDLFGRALIAAKLAKRGDYDALKNEYRRAFETRQSMHPLSSFDALIRIVDKAA